VDPELVHASSEEDEDSEIPLHPRSRQFKGLAVITAEKLPEGVTKRQATGADSMPAPVSTKIAPSVSLQNQGKSVDPIGIQPRFPVEMMSSMGVPEQSPTTGLIGAKLSATGVLPTLVSSSSSSEKLDYSGDDDDDWNNVHLAPDTSKYSHLAEEEMQVTVPETEPPLGLLKVYIYFLP